MVGVERTSRLINSINHHFLINLKLTPGFSILPWMYDTLSITHKLWITLTPPPSQAIENSMAGVFHIVVHLPGFQNNFSRYGL